MSTAWRRRNSNSTDGGCNIVLLTVLLFAGLQAWTGCDRPSSGGAKQVVDLSRQSAEEIPLPVRIYFRPLPDRMPGSENDTPELIELGQKLYFERGISLTKSQSCNDCHRLDNMMAGVDYRPTSLGATDIVGTRNAPTVLNAGFQRMQRWDGRDSDLVAQAKGPPLNPVEMAMPSEDEVVARLEADPAYRVLFRRAFPHEQQAISFGNMAFAIAAFERTLITPSRFDRYLAGDIGAITPQEKHAMTRFIDTGCVECHSSTPVGGRLMKKLGEYHPYENQSDMGRYEVTHDEQDRFVFKVCMLRNVALTPPYFHDGRISSLHEAVRLMAWMQLDTRLDDGEIDEIVVFLNALSAERPIRIARP